MYVYSVGIVDDFSGLTHLGNYIEQLKNNDDYKEELESLYYFIMEALYSAFYAKNGIAWEGDLRNDSIFVGAIPSLNELVCEKFLIIKQDNNGSTFVISYIPFEHLKNGLINQDRSDQYRRIDLPQEITNILDKFFNY